MNELWGTEKEAGTFRITRKGIYYIICDVNTKRILSENDSNLLEFTITRMLYGVLPGIKRQLKREIFRFLSNLIPFGASIITEMKQHKIQKQIISVLPDVEFLLQ